MIIWEEGGHRTLAGDRDKLYCLPGNCEWNYERKKYISKNGKRNKESTWWNITCRSKFRILLYLLSTEMPWKDQSAQGKESMRYCSQAVTKWLHKKEAITKEEQELYEYALSCLLITISPLLLVIFIGLSTGMLRNGVLIIIPFMCIRKFSGGFHTKYAWTCFLLTSAIFTFCMFMTTYMKWNRFFDFILLLAVICIGILSPVDSENRRLNEEEKLDYRRIARKMTAFFGLLYVVLCSVHKEAYAVCIAVGIILTAILQVLCVMKESVIYGKR